jgi:hypothetical protein
MANKGHGEFDVFDFAIYCSMINTYTKFAVRSDDGFIAFTEYFIQSLNPAIVYWEDNVLVVASKKFKLIRHDEQHEVFYCSPVM